MGIKQSPPPPCHHQTPALVSVAKTSKNSPCSPSSAFSPLLLCFSSSIFSLVVLLSPFICSPYQLLYHFLWSLLFRFFFGVSLCFFLFLIGLVLIQYWFICGLFRLRSELSCPPQVVSWRLTDPLPLLLLLGLIQCLLLLLFSTSPGRSCS